MIDNGIRTAEISLCGQGGEEARKPTKTMCANLSAKASWTAWMICFSLESGPEENQVTREYHDHSRATWI